MKVCGTCLNGAPCAMLRVRCTNDASPHYGRAMEYDAEHPCWVDAADNAFQKAAETKAYLEGERHG